MVEQPDQASFGKKVPTMADVVARMKTAMQNVTTAPIDCIRDCARLEEGWRATVEVIESPARLGDNDLLTAYALTLDASGELQAFERVGRYHREDVGVS